MKIREHRGGLAESMETVTEIDGTMVALVAHINAKLTPFGFVVRPALVTCTPYCTDARINWQTYMVTVDGYGVFGFTDGPVT